MKNEEVQKKFNEVETMIRNLDAELKEHKITETDNLTHIRESYHTINTQLQGLKNPVVTVMNGKEQQLFQSEVLAVLWKASQRSRFLDTVLAFLSEHKIIKFGVIIVLLFAFLGVVSTPIVTLIQIFTGTIKF